MSLYVAIALRAISTSPFGSGAPTPSEYSSLPTVELAAGMAVITFNNGMQGHLPLRDPCWDRHQKFSQPISLTTQDVTKGKGAGQSKQHLTKIAQVPKGYISSN